MVMHSWDIPYCAVCVGHYGGLEPAHPGPKCFVQFTNYAAVKYLDFRIGRTGILKAQVSPPFRFWFRHEAYGRLFCLANEGKCKRE